MADPVVKYHPKVNNSETLRKTNKNSYLLVQEEVIVKVSIVLHALKLTVRTCQVAPSQQGNNHLPTSNHPCSGAMLVSGRVVVLFFFWEVHGMFLNSYDICIYIYEFIYL